MEASMPLKEDSYSLHFLRGGSMHHAMQGHMGRTRVSQEADEKGKI